MLILLFMFRVLQIPAFHVPGFTDSGFSRSGFYRFRLFMFRVLQIPAFHVPRFTHSGFSRSGFYRFRLFMFRVFLFLVPFLVPFSDSPFLVIQIASKERNDYLTNRYHISSCIYIVLYFFVASFLMMTAS